MNFSLKFYFNITICVFLLTTRVNASVIKDALEEHLKDISHNEELESIKLEKDKAVKDHHVDSEIKDTHSNHYSKANEDTKYLKNDHESKISSENDAYGGYNNKQDKSEDNQSDGFKRGHKKGHHKQGFQNSYHKDESSNKSTYFDDINDEGDQSGYHSRLNKYDNDGRRSYEGSHNNGQEYLRNNYRNGGSNQFGDVGNKHLNHHDYGNKYYLDNSENYNKYRKGHDSYDRGKLHDRHEYQVPHHNRDPGWDWQNWNNNRRDWDSSGWDRNPGWKRDYSGPGYYDDHGIRHDGGYGYGPNHGYGYRYGESRADPVAERPINAPVVAHRKQTITIYEDPRYAGSEKGQLRREEGGYVELDYQPSSRRYASYDDTYYSVPIREKGAETSKINKLVYNYRRH
ncbi:GATA zinc finger domain-containing protein 14-like [Vanessa atalanta]|uniref:GATA zinc finger domain-containing protein 14-like n=1 Tax=Vanessa atalanta TaxID=42275 RepID=UPI001FCD6099|nr:GATA zinc finger domain-containing protein 14-like [Vanessa atalanta]